MSRPIRRINVTRGEDDFDGDEEFNRRLEASPTDRPDIRYIEDKGINIFACPTCESRPDTIASMADGANQIEFTGNMIIYRGGTNSRDLLKELKEYGYKDLGAFIYAIENTCVCMSCGGTLKIVAGTYMSSMTGVTRSGVFIISLREQDEKRNRKTHMSDSANRVIRKVNK